MSAEMIGIVITAVSLLLAIWGLMARQTAILRGEIGGVRTEMKEGDASLRTEMNNGLDSLRTEIREVETNLRTEMREGDESLRQDIRALGTRMDIQDQKMLGISARLDTLIDRSYSTELHPLP